LLLDKTHDFLLDQTEKGQHTRDMAELLATVLTITRGSRTGWRIMSTPQSVGIGLLACLPDGKRPVLESPLVAS